MYLVKNSDLFKETGTGRKVVPIDFFEYHQLFNFLEWVYPGKRQDFLKLISDQPSFVSDIVASVVAKMQESKLLEDNVIRQALECCEQILIAK